MVSSRSTSKLSLHSISLFLFFFSLPTFLTRPPSSEVPESMAGTKEAGVYHAPPAVKSFAGRGEAGAREWGHTKPRRPSRRRRRHRSNAPPQNSIFSLPLPSLPPLSNHPFQGSMGGVVEACCLQPIDVIKTRLQLDHVGRYKGASENWQRERGHFVFSFFPKTKTFQPR